MATRGNNAPTQITWVICLVLYLIAILTHFGFVHLSGQISEWSWIIGFGLLLIAVRVRGL